MKVHELKTYLESFDDDLEIRIAQPTHNHMGQEAAAAVEGACHETVYWSTYVGGYRVVEESENEPACYEDEPQPLDCVLIY